MKDPTFDLPTAHRWFAASLNNQAWGLLEAPTRSAEQNELMRNTAHAAARACHLDNQTEETDRHRAEAESARKSITDPTDRRIATDWLGRV
jgi:hypothetical protein